LPPIGRAESPRSNRPTLAARVVNFGREVMVRPPWVGIATPELRWGNLFLLAMAFRAGELQVLDPFLLDVATNVLMKAIDYDYNARMLEIGMFIAPQFPC
jgi:hypothetical protein